MATNLHGDDWLVHLDRVRAIDPADLWAAYQELRSLVRVAARFGVSAPTVAALLRDAGYAVQRPGRRHQAPLERHGQQKASEG